MNGVFRGMGAARKALQQTEASSKVMQHLDKYSLGYLPRRKQRRALRAHQQFSEPADTTIPYPFNVKNTKPQLLLKAPSFALVQGQLGETKAPEVAVVGRSNSGKSTLINALLEFNPSYVQHSKTSERPGETKDLIFYGTGLKPREDPALILCDMPGFGFAFMSEEEQKRCQELVQTYLRERGSNLKRVLLLIDARYGFKPADVEFLKSITGSSMRKVPWKMQVILTKCDIVERPMLARRVVHTREHLNELLAPVGGSKLPVLMVAAKQKNGLLPLQRELAALCPHPPALKQPNEKQGKQEKQEKREKPVQRTETKEFRRGSKEGGPFTAVQRKRGIPDRSKPSKLARTPNRTTSRRIVKG